MTAPRAPREAIPDWLDTKTLDWVSDKLLGLASGLEEGAEKVEGYAKQSYLDDARKLRNLSRWATEVAIRVGTNRVNR